MASTVAKRLIATFVAASVPNVLVGSLIDVEVWKAAVMSGAVAALGVLQALAVAYKDGKLTKSEVDEAFGS